MHEDNDFRLWVLLRKASAMTGYTTRALHGKIRRGKLQEGVHWIKAPDHHLMINMEALNQWIES